MVLRPGKTAVNRRRWPSKIGELMTFVYAPERWARRHGVTLTDRVEWLRRFVLGWLYHRAEVPILGPDDERVSYRAKPFYGPTAPWVIHVLDFGTHYDPLLADKRSRIAAGAPGLIETERFVVAGQPHLAEDSDPPKLASALRTIESQGQTAARLKWKVCKLCARVFPAVRKAKVCQICLGKLTRRQIQNRLAKAPNHPVIFRYYDATRQPQIAYFELSPDVKPPGILLRYEVWGVGTVFTPPTDS